VSDNELIIEIKGSAKEFVEALEKAKDQAGSLENQLKLTAGISGAAFAVFATEIGLATHAFAQQEIATNKLSSALQAQGIYSSKLVEDYRAQAEAIEKLTGVDAESIVTGQALFQSMVGQTKITKELTQGVVDLAARQGIDVPQAFEAVGRAVNGHTRGLKLMGVEVEEASDRQTRLAQITAGLAGQLHGAAEAANQGLGGIKGLREAYENTQKVIGERFAPAIGVAIKGMTEFFHAVEGNKVLIDLIVSITAAGAVVGGLVLAVSAGGLAFLKLKAALEAAEIATTAMSVATKGLIGATGLGLLLIIASEIYLNWNTIWPAMQAVYQTFVRNVGELAGGLGKVLSGAVTLDVTKVQEGWDQIKTAVSRGLTDYRTAVTETMRSSGRSRKSTKRVRTLPSRSQPTSARPNAWPRTPAGSQP
jgi:hypothetical protein